MKTLSKYLKILVNLLIAGGSVLIIWLFVPRLLIFFMPFVIGWIISMIAYPLVRFLESKVKILPKHSSVLIIVLVLALVVGGGYIAISRLLQETANLMTNLPELYVSLEKDFTEIGEKLQVIYNRLPENIQVAIDEQILQLNTYLGDLVKTVGKPTFTAAGNIAKNIPSFLVSLIVTIVSAYFFIADREKIRGYLKRTIPRNMQEKWDFIARKFKQVIGGYFKAQLKIMLVVAVIIFISLLLLRINYVIILTIIIAFLDFLPVFGAGTVLLPWALLKILSGDYKLAVGLLVVYGITQLVRQVIQPKLVGDSIGMNPFLTLVFIYVGYKISGVFGMIIAIPVGMIVIVLYQNGAFNNIIKYIKIVIDDINDFRKIE